MLKNSLPLRTDSDVSKAFKGQEIVLDEKVIIQALDNKTVLTFTATEDDTNIQSHFGGECGWSRQAVAGLIRRLDNGSLTQFTACFTVESDGEELGTAYLGSCFYKDIGDFFRGGYYPQLVEEAVEEAGFKVH